MNRVENRQALRSILANDKCTYPISVFDPISTRIAGELGFEMFMVAGSIMSMVVLGAPDIAVLTLTEFSDQVRRICRVADRPVMADADHGYGNALNVMRTVSELEHAGLAALTLEDTLLPAAFGFSNKAQLISIDEGVGKMRAALAARSDPSLVIVARTSAVSIAGIDEAVARAKAYAATGVDALFLAGIRSRDQIDAIAEAVRIPLILGSVLPTHPGPDFLASRRVRICLQGNTPFPAAVQAVYETMKAVRDAPPGAATSKTVPADALKRLTRERDYASWASDYLSGA